MNDTKNPNISKLDQRDALKRCIDSETDALRVQLLSGAITATVELSKESMEMTAQDESGNKKPLLLNSKGELKVEQSTELMELVKELLKKEDKEVQVKHEVIQQPIPKEYLDSLDKAIKALEELAGREVIKEIPVEKVVEKQIVIEKMPVWAWVLIGAQAAALVINLL